MLSVWFQFTLQTHLLGFQWIDGSYYDTFLPFECSSSCKILETLSSAFNYTVPGIFSFGIYCQIIQQGPQSFSPVFCSTCFITQSPLHSSPVHLSRIYCSHIHKQFQCIHCLSSERPVLPAPPHYVYHL